MVLEAGSQHLIELQRLREVSDWVLTQVKQRYAVRKALLHQLRGRARNKHLPAVSERCDPGRAMHVQADVAAAGKQRLPGVKPHPYADHDARGPGMAYEATLGVDRRGECVVRPRKGGEHCVALRVNLVPTMAAIASLNSR